MSEGRPGYPNGPSNGLPRGGSAGDCGPFRRVVRIVNPLGLHHRVADRFARTASGFDARIIVRNGELSADGKSLWDLMMLLAFEGTDVVLELDGPEAAAAVEPLAAILAARGGEDYAI
jgi:phosphotransferase system HPr (HPr) family protein